MVQVIHIRKATGLAPPISHAGQADPYIIMKVIYCLLDVCVYIYVCLKVGANQQQTRDRKVMERLQTEKDIVDILATPLRKDQ